MLCCAGRKFGTSNCTSMPACSAASFMAASLFSAYGSVSCSKHSFVTAHSFMHLGRTSVGLPRSTTSLEPRTCRLHRTVFCMMDMPTSSVPTQQLDRAAVMRMIMHVNTPVARLLSRSVRLSSRNCRRLMPTWSDLINLQHGDFLYEQVTKWGKG